jgi:broad specificity phosphatase PhoE
MEKDSFVIKLLFTRHGETEENVKHIICGQRPGALTKMGV